MGLAKDDREKIVQDILENISSHPNDIVKVVSEKHSISRQSVNKYVSALITEGAIEKEGTSRNTRYKLKTTSKVFTFRLSEIRDEDRVWRENIIPVLPEMSKNVKDICAYGFTEMFNNVIEHSQANGVIVTVKYSRVKINFIIIDTGIGIFNKIQEDFKLEDPKHAIFELSKGKLTSAPENHSGEGIFFTSRVFDRFYISSENLFFSGHRNSDWLLEQNENIKGTLVYMEIGLNSTTKLVDVFSEYTSGEEFGFTKTIVPVKLLGYDGMALVSRSQAKRLIARFDKFEEVVLDFSGIEIIGQAFADELFRVFKNQFPNVNLVPICANSDVDKMIKHVLYKKGD